MVMASRYHRLQRAQWDSTRLLIVDSAGLGRQDLEGEIVHRRPLRRSLWVEALPGIKTQRREPPSFDLQDTTVAPRLDT